MESVFGEMPCSSCVGLITVCRNSAKICNIPWTGYKNIAVFARAVIAIALAQIYSISDGTVMPITLGKNDFLEG